SVSCATCHDLSRSGADVSSVPNQISVGAGWSAVNAGHVVNAAYYDLPFWNGRDDSLWAMIIPVAESATAMGSDRVHIARAIDDNFDCMTKEDQEKINRIIVNFSKAIAAFEYQLTSRDSPFDRGTNGGARLSEGAVRGARLYTGKASCIECHSTPLLSDNQYH